MPLSASLLLTIRSYKSNLPKLSVFLSDTYKYVQLSGILQVLFSLSEQMIQKRLKIIRKTTGMTQREFASKLGVSHTYISELEGGRRTPSKLFMVAVEHVFGVNQSWLAAGKGEKYRKDRILFSEDEIGVIKQLRGMSEENRKIFIVLSEKLKKK